MHVREVPPTTGIVGHNIGLSCNVILLGDVAVVALVEGASKSEEICTSSTSHGKSFCCLRMEGTVVPSKPDGAFGDNNSLYLFVFEHHGSRKLQVGD